VPDGAPPAPSVQLRNVAAFTGVTGFTVRARGHSGFAGTARASRIALHIGQPASFCAESGASADPKRGMSLRRSRHQEPVEDQLQHPQFGIAGSPA